MHVCAYTSHHRSCYSWRQNLTPIAGNLTTVKSNRWEMGPSGILKRSVLHCCSYDVISKTRNYRNEKLIHFLFYITLFLTVGMVVYSGKHCRKKPFKNNQISFFLLHSLIFLMLAFWNLPKLTCQLDGTFLQYFKTVDWSNTKIIVNVKK